MNKEKYERTELEVISFQMDDILSASKLDEYELERNEIRFPMI